MANKSVLLLALAASAAFAADPLAPSASPAALPAVEPSARRPVTLVEALKFAGEKNAQLLSARAQAKLAEIDASRVWGALLPDINASGSLVHTSAPAELDLKSFVDLVDGVFLLSPPQAYGGQGIARNDSILPKATSIVAPNSAYGTLQVTQSIFTPQLLLLPAAFKARDAAALGADEAREQILLGVARVYFGLVGLRELTNAARDAETVALKREKDARNQMAAGMAVEVALLRAQAETAQARSTLAQLDGQREALLAMLEALTGEAIRPTDEPQTLPFDARPQASEASAVWKETYGVRAANKGLEVAETFASYSRWSWMPSFAAFAKGNYNSNSGFSGKVASYDLGVAMSWKLYDRGDRYVELRQNDAKLADARAKASAAESNARATWISARANLTAAEAALVQAQAQADLAARAQKQVESAFRAGVSTALEQSDIDNKRFLAASAAAQARATVEIRRVELAAAEGRLAKLAGIE